MPHGKLGIMDPVQIVLDCDPGHDDAVAIVVAAAYTDLLGITTVAGNASLQRTTYNACVIRDLMGFEVPVHSGAERPLLAEPRDASMVHGASGLDGADLPVPARGADSADAISFLIQTCRANEGVWLVATGPLTNIALALRAAPDLRHRVAGISIMGGGTFGNRSPVAEFNIWADPEAAAVVFASGLPLVMAGLDVTHRFIATEDRIGTIRAVPGLLAATLADLFEFFSASYRGRHTEMTGAAVHDPVAVLALSHPEVFTRVSRHVDIETTGTLTRGMTVVDQRTLVDRPAPNCQMLTDLDADRAWQLTTEAIAAFSS
jgi:inosine-uridine nucleoside N-ribohydrolase